MLKTITSLFKYEVLILLRGSKEWLYPLAFFVIIMSFFPLAFTPEQVFFETYFVGCVWIAALLASLFSVQNILLADLEDGHLEQLLLSSIPLPCLLWIKIFAYWLITAFPLIILTPLFGGLFHISFYNMLLTSFSLVIGTPILLFVGSLTVSLTLGLRQQGILLAVLVLPFVLPILIFSVVMLRQAQAGLTIAPCALLITGIALLCTAVMPFVLAVTLKFGMDD